jgi:hypothetical protein
MTVVIQPNVITPDQRAGVQVGDLVLVTETGIEPLHRAPRGLIRIDKRAFDRSGRSVLRAASPLMDQAPHPRR